MVHESLCEKGGRPRITASSALQQGRSGQDLAVPGWVFRSNFEQSDSVWGWIILFNPLVSASGGLFCSKNTPPGGLGREAIRVGAARSVGTIAVF